MAIIPRADFLTDEMLMQVTSISISILNISISIILLNVEGIFSKDDESEVPKDNFEDVDGVAGRGGTFEEDEDDEDDTNKPVPMPEYRSPT